MAHFRQDAQTETAHGTFVLTSEMLILCVAFPLMKGEDVLDAWKKPVRRRRSAVPYELDEETPA